MTSLLSSSPCQRHIDWPVSGMTWCFSFTSIKDGEEPLFTSCYCRRNLYIDMKVTWDVDIFQAVSGGQNQSKWIRIVLRWKRERKISSRLTSSQQSGTTLSLNRIPKHGRDVQYHVCQGNSFIWIDLPIDQRSWCMCALKWPMFCVRRAWDTYGPSSAV